LVHRALELDLADDEASVLNWLRGQLPPQTPDEALGALADETLRATRAWCAHPLYRPARASDYPATPLAPGSEAWRELSFRLRTDEADLSGMIDYVIRRGGAGRDGDDEWTVIDFKTDRVGSPADTESHVAQGGYDLQTAVYALALRRLAQVRRVETRLYFTNAGTEWKRVYAEDGPHSFADVEARIDAMARTVRDGPYARGPQALCATCEFAAFGLCDAASSGSPLACS
jgi:hypothetical protein